MIGRPPAPVTLVDAGAVSAGRDLVFAFLGVEREDPHRLGKIR